MERNFMKDRIIAMLDEVNDENMDLIYRFVCCLLYRKTK